MIDNMKKALSNFTEVDSRDQHKWQRVVRDAYESLGYTFLGAGKYAVVFSIYCKGMKKEIVVKVFMRDAAYFKWLEFAMNNQNNPYVPEIYGKVQKLTDLFYQIEMEKLSPANSSSVVSLYSDLDSSAPYAAEISEEFDANQNLLDLHSENVMMRGSQVVVIDPYYNWFKRGSYTIDPNQINEDLFY